MQIVHISTGTFGGGSKLAEKLAAKLGYDCLSREELCAGAAEAGIRVDKLEEAVARRRPLTEQLDIEKERYKAFVTATIAERALAGGLVYHGRAGQLLLPGVGHLLRIRAIMDPEIRAGITMKRLLISRQQARAHTRRVDEDRRRWVRVLYDIDWEDPVYYDNVVNLSHVNVNNAATALVATAQLPEFQPTPAARKALEDLLLAARCRLALGEDPRTRHMNVQVRSERSHVLATYLPLQKRYASPLPEIISKIDGVEEVVCTMAATNILWIEERFEAQGEPFDHILDIARRWDAAVELVKLGGCADKLEPAENGAAVLVDEPGEHRVDACLMRQGANMQVEPHCNTCVREVMSHLISVGRAGGFRCIPGGPGDLLQVIDRTAPYSLVVVGTVGRSKGASVCKRLSSELVSHLSDNLRVPVVSAETLEAEYRFGPRQWTNLLLYGLAAAILFGVVITHQAQVLAFTSQEGVLHRILSTAALFLFVPLFAHAYGTFTHHVWKLLRFE